jgi:hypothetical protein
MDPPGCITAVIPASFANCTQSGREKKHRLPSMRQLIKSKAFAQPALVHQLVMFVLFQMKLVLIFLQNNSV